MKIAIFAPGSPIAEENRKTYLAFSQGRKFQDFADFQKSEFPFLAAPDETRWKSFQKALKAKPQVLWGVRGGYGSLRLLPKLQQMKKPAKCPVLLGISDLTVFHMVWNLRWKKPSLHGPLVDRVALGQLPADVEEEFWRILDGRQHEIVHRLNPMNSRAKKYKSSKLGGEQIVGGNLSTLCSMLASGFSMNLKNKFLFLEDRGERGYQVDRMLAQLSQGGVFKNVRGVLFGHFNQSAEPTSSGQPGADFVPLVLNAFAQKNPFPVFSGIESGHDTKLRVVPFCSPADIRDSLLRVEVPKI